MSPTARMESHLREARQEMGMSQEALARKLGVSRNTVVAIERGESVPNVLLALAIAGIVAWAVHELFKNPGSEGGGSG